MPQVALTENHPTAADNAEKDEIYSDEASSADTRDLDDSALNGGTRSDEDGPTATGGKASAARPNNGSKAVFVGKILVVAVLVLSACALGIATYFFISNQQESDFENAFEKFGQTLLDGAEAKISQSVDLMRSLATSMTAYAIDGNISFPFVTLPNYVIRANSALELSGADSLGWDPLIPQDQVPAWEKYAVDHQDELYQGLGVTQDAVNISTHLQYFFPNRPYYVALWSYVPPIPDSFHYFNFDLAVTPWFHQISAQVLYFRQVILSSASFGFNVGATEPQGNLLLPVFANFSQVAPVVGFQSALFRFQSFFRQVLPPGTGRLVVEATDSCGGEYSYSVDGPNSDYLGHGLLHDPKFSKYRLEIPFARFLNISLDSNQTGTNQFNETVDLNTVCQHTFAVYPTEQFQKIYYNSDPYLYAVVVICVFIFTTLVFVLYDWLVRRYQAKIAAKAERSQAIVASLFPKNVQDRILQDVDDQQDIFQGYKRSVFGVAPRAELKQLLGSSTPDTIQPLGKPIADLFTATTVMFADICNFTAWSSSREPSQVFILLETIYRAFDEIADRRGVFKVETVGDCYVAVAGLPDPRPDHAVVMARYANDCFNKFFKLTKQMEVTLGPDTTDLGLRVGLHSGPVTAGVLRGQRARFQLFGDTVNTAARMESTGERNRIQISQETSVLLASSGKGHWCQSRNEKVTAKGKGELQTFWLQIKKNAPQASVSGTSNNSSNDVQEINDDLTDEIDQVIAFQTDVEKHMRLVDWNTEILVSKLKVLVAFRRAHQVTPDSPDEIRSMEVEMLRKKGLVIDEVEEVLWLPDYHQFHDNKEMDLTQVDLGEAVVKQLHDYVHTLSNMYRVNAFHNFEHASHVTMSVNKLFSRIIAPEIADHHHQGDVYSTLHDHTYGITSDPLTQFAVVLAALIHDVDHPGVANSQLIKEKAPLAVAYRDKSVAEQNSVDIAWELLMDESFEELRRTIYVTAAELRRFRQWLVNNVMATDIMDKDLKALRNARWEKAFADNSATAGPSQGLEEKVTAIENPTLEIVSSLDRSNKSFFSKGSSSQVTLANMEASSSASLARNRKATIIIEHLIQASDVAHTMQHWHVYRKWNTRLFMEMYQAYMQGRGVDPSGNWYQGELGFLDYYVIPLASKLKECGVFGVSSEEYLTYAKQNRAEWEVKGQEVVEELQQEAKRLIISRLSVKTPP